MKESRSVRVGKVYLAGCAYGDGPMKVGFSWAKSGIPRRLRMLIVPSQTRQPVPADLDRARFELLAHCEGTFALEREVQRRLKAFGIENEWFRLPSGVRDFVTAATAAGCGPVTIVKPALRLKAVYAGPRCQI